LLDKINNYNGIIVLKLKELKTIIWVAINSNMTIQYDDIPESDIMYNAIFKAIDILTMLKKTSVTNIINYRKAQRMIQKISQNLRISESQNLRILLYSIIANNFSC